MKKILLWLFMITSCSSIQSADGSSWNWYSWKVLVPAAILAGTSTGGVGLYHYIKRKANIEVKEWHDVKLMFLLFIGMKVGEYTRLTMNNISEETLDKIPLIRNRGREKDAITWGISTGKKANKWTVFKMNYNGIRSDRGETRNLEEEINRPKY